MKFIKKAVEVEAVQYWHNADEVAAFVGDASPKLNTENQYAIATLEGVMFANHGDWIIKGVKGEFYPCKPDIFEATYRPADAKLTYHVPVDEPNWTLGEWVAHLEKAVGEKLNDYHLGLFINYVKHAHSAKVMDKTTICVLKLHNGFEVVGTSACANPSDYVMELGEWNALAQALNKVGEYVGFLRQQNNYEDEMMRVGLAREAQQFTPQQGVQVDAVQDRLQEIVTQLESCEYTCVGGSLSDNSAFRELKHMAQR